MYELIDAFATYLAVERGASDNTISAYTKDLLQLTQFLIDHSDDAELELDSQCSSEEVDIHTVSKSDLRLYIGYLYDRGLDFSSVERKIASVKVFFTYLFKQELIGDNPATTLDYPKKKRRLPNFLTERHIDSILSFECTRFIDYRDKALLLTLYSTGCRVSEISSAQWIDFEIEKRRLKVLGKGNVERVVFLGGKAFEALLDYHKNLAAMTFEEPTTLFVNTRGGKLTERGIFYIVNKRARDAGFFESVTPHTFRHSFATTLMDNGADIRAVQEMLGHKNISTTQVYTHTTRARLKKVYQNFHPHAE